MNSIFQDDSKMICEILSGTILFGYVQKMEAVGTTVLMVRISTMI